MTAPLASALDPWLRSKALLVGSGELVISVLGEGHSNLTYLLQREDALLVLRRPPLGPLLPTAHDVVREYRMLELLANSATPVRVPHVRGLCEDAAVIGAPFYVMDRADGIVIRNELPSFLSGESRRSARTQVGAELVAALAEIHTVDWQPFVAADIGQPAGYLDRQLRRWVGQREGIQSAVSAAGGTARELPDYDVVRDWLRAHRPDEASPAVVHGDYKLDNVVIAPTAHGATITAVIDWEMATVGDPRADLGYFLAFWFDSADPLPLAELVIDADGFLGADEVVDRWQELTARRAEHLDWFRALAIWKLAILLEASYHRWLAGMSQDPFFARLDEGVPALLAKARRICRV